MANEILFNATTQIYENLPNVTQVYESLYNATTQIYENLPNVTQVSESLFTDTQMYNLPNVTQLHHSFINDTPINGSWPNVTHYLNDTPINESLSEAIPSCNKTTTLYPSEWDMILATEVVLNAVVCILGILGNIYALVMVFGIKLKTWVHTWKKCMAICDLLLLLCYLNQVTVARIARSFLSAQNHNVSLYSHVWVILYPIEKMIETASAWITVTVVIERCLLMYHPGNAASFFKDRMSGLLFLLITIFAASINFPRFREFEVRKCYDVQFNITSKEVWENSVTDVIAHYRWNLSWVYICVTYIVPFLIFITSSILLLRAVHVCGVDKEKLNKVTEPEVNSVRMIVCFIVVFCVCKLPKMVEEIYSHNGISVELMAPFSNLMLSLNSAVNFVVYTLF